MNMFELAVTRGTEFIRFTRNARAIVLPDGATVLGPLVRLPHRQGDYVIRAVVGGGVSTQPPIVVGDVVVV